MSLKPSLPFLAGNSAMARLMREHDWSGCPLGPPDQWPQELCSVVGLMLGSALPMYLGYGPELTFLYNDSHSALLGAKHPAALGAPLLDIFPEIRDAVLPLVQRALDGEAFLVENLPLRMRWRGVEEDAWFTFSYSPLRDRAGAIAGLFCACTETTRTVLVAQTQEAQQQRLQALFDQAPGFAAVLRGPGHVFEMVNQAYLQLTGDRDIIGKPVAQALPEMLEQGFVTLLDQVRASGKPFVGRSTRVVLHRERDAPLSEAYVDFVLQPVTDKSGQVESIFVQGHEVTEWHLAQQALLAFANSIPAIAWVTGPDGGLQRFNSQWCSYTGQSEDESLGYRWTAALHPDDMEATWQAWKAARAGNAAWQAEYRLRRHDGSYRWFHSRAVPQLDAAGRALHWFGTTTDIDDAKKSAQALRDADRQKDEFLATLAHELRNPLAPIRTAVHLLAAAESTEAARLRATDTIGRQIVHMSRLLDDLMDVARITQRRLVLKPEAVSVESVLQAVTEAARPLADAKQQELTVTLTDPGIRVTADPVRLAQILSNLLNNASKYTDRGGRIALDAWMEGTWLSFTVTDNGIGLSEGAVQNVFAMFAQEQSALERSEGGLGIGLALAKGLVELHGGTVSAHSEGAGRGSRFVVRLPCSAAMTASAPGPQDAAPAVQPVRATTVLVADDNRDAADMLAELLRLGGHAVHTAYDGLQAVEQALQLEPDVLVLDIGMPGLNGYEVARQVRGQPWGALPLLIAATGWGNDEDRNKAMAAGFDVHLTKPLDPQQLMALIAARAASNRAEQHQNTQSALEFADFPAIRQVVNL